MIICLSSELDPKYEKIAIRHLFLPDAPLFKHGILELAEEGNGSRPQLTSALRLNLDVLADILGEIQNRRISTRREGMTHAPGIHSDVCISHDLVEDVNLETVTVVSSKEV